MSRQIVGAVWRGTCLALLLMLALASPAGALPLRKIGPGSVWTDGVRYAVFFPANQAWWPREVLDERSGRRYTVTAPTSPPAPGFQAPSLCLFQDVAGGSVLWSCPSGEPRYLLTELATGIVRAVPGWEELERSLSEFEPTPSGGHADVAVVDFGRRWLHVQASDLGGGNALLANRWLDWRTGTLVRHRPGGSHRVIDLDDPRLAVPLCAPLRRRIEPFEDYGPDVVLPYVYERPWLFSPVDPPQRHAIKIRRCARRRPLILHRCRHTCGPVNFGAGYVTWIDKPKFSIFNPPPPVTRRQTIVFAFDVRRHRRLGFRANFGLRPPDYLWHTRRHIYAQTAFLPSPTLYVGRLPKRR
jgi:hypothetical protein